MGDTHQNRRTAENPRGCVVFGFMGYLRIPVPEHQNVWRAEHTCWRCGSRLNITNVFPMYGDSHVKDKTVARTNGWINNRDAGDLRRIRVHYDVTVMKYRLSQVLCNKPPFGLKSFTYIRFRNVITELNWSSNRTVFVRFLSGQAHTSSGGRHRWFETPWCLCDVTVMESHDSETSTVELLRMLNWQPSFLFAPALPDLLCPWGRWHPLSRTCLLGGVAIAYITLSSSFVGCYFMGHHGDYLLFHGSSWGLPLWRRLRQDVLTELPTQSEYRLPSNPLPWISSRHLLNQHWTLWHNICSNKVMCW